MLRTVALRLLLASLVVIASFLLGEAFVRLAGGPPARFVFSGSFRDVQTDWDVVYGVDEHNQRVTCRSRETTPDAHHLAVIGDSFVFGQGVPDCEVFVSRLDGRSDDWDFENLGVVGSGIATYIVVARDLLGEPVDSALVLFYGNDLSSLHRGRSFFGPLADRFSTFALLRRTQHALLVRGLLGEQHDLEEGDAGRVRRPEWTWEGRHNNTVAGVRKDPRVLRRAVDPGPEAEALFRARFAELAEHLTDRLPPDAVYIAMVPEGHTVSHRLREFVTGLGAETAPFGEPGPAYALVRALALEHGFHFIETFEAFRRGGDALYFPHDLHWSPEGHRTMAGLVADALGMRGDQADAVLPSPAFRDPRTGTQVPGAPPG